MMIYRPYWKQKITDAIDDPKQGVMDVLELTNEYVAALENDLEKWENWKPDDETLEALQDQARARDGSYTNSLGAQSAYIGGLEGRVRDLEQRLKLAEMVIRTFVPVNVEQKQALIDYPGAWVRELERALGVGENQ